MKNRKPRLSNWTLQRLDQRVERDFRILKREGGEGGYVTVIQRMLAELNAGKLHHEVGDHAKAIMKVRRELVKEDLNARLDFYRCPACRSLDCDDGYCKG